ncbi:hypothetical protein [Klebsiella pneumoniae]|uniref:hypothetical protein n=1 Tax=Klebsiella pneumoniae TaxID=573 RepID=UPI004045356F
MTTDITELAQRNELLIANGQLTADLLRHLADNEIDSDYFAVVSECESYGKETDAELSITEFALRAAGYVDALVEALEKAQQLATQQGNIACALFDEVTAQRQRIAELEESHAQVIQSRDHYKRISEEGLKQLAESRTVTVKLPDINEYLAEVHDKTLNRAFRLLAEGVRAGDVAAMRAAGIKVEAE